MMQPDIFGGNYELVLTPDEQQMFHRPVNEDTVGGYQSLALKMQGRESKGRLLVTDEELCSIYRKAWAYGDGTWEQYFRVLEDAGRRVGWKPPEALVDDVWQHRHQVLSRRVE